ncbi:hypothetical protein AA313_de0204856 [Arthrobotrys entomopaga]|nr:hypothetical protein AA313_de0204856 [Arthrobotrys entomopaga]
MGWMDGWMDGWGVGSFAWGGGGRRGGLSFPLVSRVGQVSQKERASERERKKGEKGNVTIKKKNIIQCPPSPLLPLFFSPSIHPYMYICKVRSYHIWRYWLVPGPDGINIVLYGGKKGVRLCLLFIIIILLFYHRMYQPASQPASPTTAVLHTTANTRR